MRDSLLNSLIVDLGIFITIFSTYLILALVMQQRFCKKVTIAILAIYTVILWSASYYFGIRSTVQVNAIRCGSYLPLLIILYKGKLYQKVFVFFLHFLILNFLIAISEQIIRFFIPVERDTLFVTSSIILYSLLYSGYLIFLCLFWKNIFHKLFYQENSPVQILYAIGIVFSYAVFAALRIVLVSGVLYGVLMLFVMWSLIILCYSVINTHEKTKQKYEADFSKEIISSWESHYKKTDHLLSMHIFNQKTEERKMYNFYFCDNRTINNLLGWFAHRCEKEGIKYSFKVDLPQNLSISDFDICIIVGNLLENALESCRETAEGKSINLNLMLHNEQFVLKSENTCGSCTKNEEEISPGLHSVKLVTERYKGNIFLKSNDGIYTVSVLIPLEGENN